jgi:hypothetical protein
MTHPLVTQLQFARSEFIRCMDGVLPEEAMIRHGSMNCLSWIVGHLASQEQHLWVEIPQGRQIDPGLSELVGFQRPASTPSWDQMWSSWRAITLAADGFLKDITEAGLDQHLIWRGEPRRESVGTLLLRNIYHYWFHLGEAHAIRQVLGHKDLPDFVGNMRKVRY